MTQLTHQTPVLKEKEIQRSWNLIDARHKILGRLACEVSEKLIGKKKHKYAPYIDSGDHVVVINARDIKITGKKIDQKKYKRYSGYPGGLKEESLKSLLSRDPKKVIEHAVSGMLPKNKFRKNRMTRLHVFNGPEHTFKNKITT